MSCRGDTPPALAAAPVFSVALAPPDTTARTFLEAAAHGAPTQSVRAGEGQRVQAVQPSQESVLEHSHQPPKRNPTWRPPPRPPPRPRLTSHQLWRPRWGGGALRAAPLGSAGRARGSRTPQRVAGSRPFCDHHHFITRTGHRLSSHRRVGNWAVSAFGPL